MEYTCETCKTWIKIPIEGVNAVFSHNRWYCAMCVDIKEWKNGEPIVNPKSEGKLVPKTILYD